MVSGRLVGEELQKTKQYKFMLWKAYFDKGYAFLSYPKYILFLVGLGDVIASGGNYWNVVIIGAFIGVACFIFGKILYKKNFVDAELEVTNVFNPFQREVRSYMEVSGADRKL